MKDRILKLASLVEASRSILAIPSAFDAIVKYSLRQSAEQAGIGFFDRRRQAKHHVVTNLRKVLLTELQLATLICCHCQTTYFSIEPYLSNFCSGR